MATGRCSEVEELILKMLGRDLELSLLTGGRYFELVVNTGLTVCSVQIQVCYQNTQSGFLFSLHLNPIVSF